MIASTAVPATGSILELPFLKTYSKSAVDVSCIWDLTTHHCCVFDVTPA